MKHCGQAPSFRCTVALSVQKPNPCLLVFLFFFFFSCLRDDRSLLIGGTSLRDVTTCSVIGWEVMPLLNHFWTRAKSDRSPHKGQTCFCLLRRFLLMLDAMIFSLDIWFIYIVRGGAPCLPSSFIPGKQSMMAQQQLSYNHLVLFRYALMPSTSRQGWVWERGGGSAAALQIELT